MEAEKRILSQLESDNTDQRLSDLSFYHMGLIMVCCRYVAGLAFKIFLFLGNKREAFKKVWQYWHTFL